MITEYFNNLHDEFGVGDDAKGLFERIATAPVEKREEILKDMSSLISGVGLSYALIALFRQQVNCGFVLADPLAIQDGIKKTFYDEETNVTFVIQWNKHREIRRNHSKLVEMGVIAGNVNSNELINKDKDGKACYLCKTNIDIQNPREIILDVKLAGRKYYIGANLAFITNNHFTVMNCEHVSQRYQKGVVEALNDFIEMTNGYYRGIFNGLAGASIKEHEHIQVSPETFPIEEINVSVDDAVYSDADITVSVLNYYMTVWLVEGSDKVKVNCAADEIITKWKALDREFHTINIIGAMDPLKNLFRTFVVLRDKRKLAGGGKRGAMASFESGGNLILSCVSKKRENGSMDEKELFEKADLDTIKQMIGGIAADKDECSSLVSSVNFST